MVKLASNERIIISACLAGVNCKYNGGNNEVEKITRFINEHNVILVCPEQMGGMPTPRCPAELKSDKVITKRGKDVTENYVKGAKEVLKIAKRYKVKKAVLKARSPSCGKGLIYDGSFTNQLKKGNGITAQLLIDNGIEVVSNDDI